MKRTLVLTLALVAVMAAAAAASVPDVVWFFDDFNYAVANGTPLIVASEDWDGDPATNNKILLYNGEARINANNQVSTAWADITGESDVLQIFHARVKGGGGNASSTFAYIAVYDLDGEDLARWQGASTWLTPWIAGGTAGTTLNMTLLQYYDLDIVYNPLDGLTQFFVDGNLQWSTTQGTGKAIGGVYLWSRYNLAVVDNVFVDEVAIGTNAVPEPGGLLALSVFGVGMAGYIKRRKA